MRTPGAAIVCAILTACARPASDADRVLHAASRDLGCPATRLVQNASGQMETVPAFPVRRGMGAHWIATCHGRTARYRCGVRGCHRDELDDSTPGIVALDAGALECRTLGAASDGGRAAAAALVHVADRIATCGAQGVMIRVAPLTGALVAQDLVGSAPAGAGRCFVDAIRGAAAVPAPPDQQLLVCRPR